MRMPSFAAIMRGDAWQKRQVLFFVIGIVAGFVVVKVELQLFNDWPSSDEKVPSSMARFTPSGQARQDEISQHLSKKIRVLCWIMTCPAKLNASAAHVHNTWAKRCTKVLYMSSEDTTFPTIAIVDHLEGREYLWPKSRGSHQYIYDHHGNDFDWFLKADDDTYVIVENLRMLVAQYDPNKPFHLGRRLLYYKEANVSFMSGGAGYVLSKEALKILVEEAFQSPYNCSPITVLTQEEDVMIAKCLWNFGVEPVDAVIGGRESFHCFAPPVVLQPDAFPIEHWYAQHSYHPIKRGLECCSEYSISFHYVEGYSMYMLEYMIYHMRPFGVGYHDCTDDIMSIVGALT